MQDITTKLARVAAVTKAAGLTTDQARHLIHGTGGSPRRAKRAIRMGIHTALIDAYVAALADGGSHTQATIACNKLYLELVPSAPTSGPDDDSDATDGDEGAAEEAAAAVTKAAAPAKRIRKAAVKPAAKKGAAELAALL